MDLVWLVIVLCLVGFLVWILTTRIPMPAGWPAAIQITALVLVLLYVLTRVVHLPNLLR